METQEQYLVSADMKNGILEMTILGKVTGANVNRLQKEILNTGEAGSSRLLVDLRPLDQKICYANVLYHVRRPENSRCRIAIVDWPDNQDVKLFCENMAVNAYMKIKYFDDIDRARHWLHNTNASNTRFHF
jgi:hypothetical protein